MKHRGLLFLLAGCCFLFACTQPGSISQTPQAPEQPAGDPILVIEPQGHSATVSELMFTPDGTMLVSVSEDKTIRLWDVETGDLLRTIRGEIGDSDSGVLQAGALSPDGKTLAVTGFFMQPLLNVLPVVRRIRLFNLETGEQTGLSPRRYTWYLSYAVAFSPDGRLLANGGEENVVRLWNVSDTGDITPIATLQHTGNVRSLAFSPDGKRLVAASSAGTLRLWALPQDIREIHARLPYTEMTRESRRHTAPVQCVVYAPDGQYIVSGSADGTILLWDENGTFLNEIAHHAGAVATISFSSDSQHIVAAGGGDFQAVVYAIPSGEQLTTFSNHTNSVTASAFSGTDWVATAGGDRNEIYIWNARSGTVKTHIIGQGKRITALALSQTGDDGRVLAFGHPREYPENHSSPERSFDCSEMTLSDMLPADTRFTRTSPEYQGHTLKLVTPYKLRVTGGGSIETAPGFGGQILTYSFTPAGDVIIGSDQFLKRYRNDGTFLHWFGGHTGPAVRAIAVSEDGRILASATDDQTIKLWNLTSGEHLVSFFLTEDREWILWTPQGYYAASAGGERYIGWHLNQGEDRAAKFYPVADFRERFHRPQLVKRTIELGSFAAALAESRLDKTAITHVLPPEVVWLAPQSLITTTAETSIRIRAKIYSDSAITEIKPLLNARPVSTGRGLYVVTQVSDVEQEIDWTVSLKPGRNRIALYVANQNASDTSEERIVLCSASAAAAPGKNVYMVSIGISAYQQKGLQLQYADDDAKAMSRAFLAQKGQLYSHVDLKELYDEQATRPAIVQALEWLKSRATTRNDLAIVFVAAHGYSHQEQYYLLPADGDPEHIEETGVSWQVFSDILGNLPAQVVLFLDTCHSGQLGADFRGAGRSADNTEAIRRLSSDNYGVVILAASTGRELSLEHGEWGHGAFTKALLEGMEQGKADYSGDGLIQLRELDLYVAERVEFLTNGLQHPTTQKPSTISRFSLAQVRVVMSQ